MLLDLLKKRYSCRHFIDKPIPEVIIHYILECGRLSPSGGNEQPWKFGVITDKTLIRKITEAASVNYQQDWIAAAPLLIVLCTQVFNDGEVGMHRFPSYHDRMQRIDRDLYVRIEMEEHQTKIPGEHMVLAALEHGIYSTWISSVNCEKVADLIGLTGYVVSNVIALGYPEQGAPRAKKEMSDITFINHYVN